MADKEVSSPIGCWNLLILNIVDLVGVTIWHGWVIATLWLWFVVPQFHLATISLRTAIGLDLLVTMVTLQISFTELRAKPTAMEYWARVVVRIMAPLLLLLIGLIAR